MADLPQTRHGAVEAANQFLRRHNFLTFVMAGLDPAIQFLRRAAV
jgi:hypothetical protein